MKKFWKSLGQISAVAGIIILVVFVIVVRPKEKTVPDREVVRMWQVVGAEDDEPVGPKWFNESQDKYYVEPIGLPFLEIEQKFLTSAVGNTPPDVFNYFGSVVQWSTRGALMPLDDFIERDGIDRSQIFDAAWQEMMWDGRTFAIPTGTADEAFFWNKEHFREAGLDPDRPPQTWDELEEYAVKLTTYNDDGSIDRAGYIPGYWSPWGTPIFLDWPVQLGAKFVSDDGTKVNLASDATIRALKWEADLFKKLGRDALITKRSSFGFGAQQGFMSGQVSMIVQKSSFPLEILRYSPDLDYGVSFLPVPEKGKQGVVAGAVWIGIPKGARNPEGAWEYIKFLIKPETQMRTAEYMVDKNLAGFFPSNIEVATSPFMMKQPHMDVFVDYMKYGRSPTVVPLAHTQFWRSYQQAWDSCMRGLATPEEALTKAQEEVQRALDEQLAYNMFYREYLRRHAPGGGGAAPK